MTQVKTTIKILIKLFVMNIISFLGGFIPKQNKAIFASDSGYADNARAMYEYLSNTSKLQVVWAYNQHQEYSRAEKFGAVVKRNSVSFLYHFYTSKFIFTTHMEFLFITNSDKQTYISLWHGMPFKNIGLLENGDGLNYSEQINLSLHRKKTNYCFVNSELFRLVFSASFDIPVRKVLPFGQPRMDLLFSKKQPPPFIDNFAKVLLYCPTFRNSSGKFKRKDSEWSIDYFCETYLTDELITFLEKNNYLLIIKLHPFESQLVKESFGRLSKNILNIDNDYLQRHDTDLYELLSHTDLLITDYSSIFIDYMILDRPIVFLIEDLEDYSSSRSFLLNSFEDFSPGHKLKNAGDFIHTITDALNNDPFSSQRIELSKLLNGHTKHGNCERISVFLDLN